MVLALQGNDVFYSAYKEGTLLSTAAAPIVYRDMTIGAIYVRDRDETQGTLLMNLQQNLRTISLVLAVIAPVGERPLFPRCSPPGSGPCWAPSGWWARGVWPPPPAAWERDELAHLAEEFNQLTDRSDHRGGPPPFCLRRLP